MRNFCGLLGTLALAIYTTQLWTTADPTATYLLWEGLLLTGVTILLTVRFATSSLVRAAASVAAPFAVRPTTAGHVSLWTGAICALLGSGLHLLANRTQPSPALLDISAMSLWWLGVGLLMVAVLWPGTWRITGRTATASQPAALPIDLLTSARTWQWVTFCFITFIAAGVRLFFLSQQPAFCVGAECEAALALSTASTAISLFALLPGVAANNASVVAIFPQLIYNLTEAPLFSIRLAVMLVTIGTVPLFYLFTRRLVGNGVALLGALLLLFSPWFNALNGETLSIATTLFWCCAALWLLAEAFYRQQPRWALLAGLCFGMATTVPFLQFAMLFWLLLLGFCSMMVPIVASGTAPRNFPKRSSFFSAILTLIGFGVIAAPTMITESREGLALASLASQAWEGATWIFALLQPGLLNAPWSAIAPLDPVLAMLTFIGIGTLLRNLNNPLFLWLSSGLLIFGILFVYMGLSPMGNNALALLLLLSTITAVLALHTIVAAFYQNWQPLLPFANLVATASAVLLLLLIPPLLRMVGTDSTPHSATAMATTQAMTERIATLLAERPDATFFAPATLIEAPTTRLQLGEEMLARLRPLSTVIDAIYTMDNPGDMIYVIPTQTRAYIDLLQRVQPGLIMDWQIDPENGESLFAVLTATATSRAEQRGLRGIAWENATAGTGSPVGLPPTGALTFAPEEWQTLQTPLTIQWSGALRVAMPGTYRFMLDLPQIDPQTDSPNDSQASAALTTNPTISLQLDDRLILDTSLGLDTQELTLVKGFYQVTLLYQSAPDSVATEASQPNPVVDSAFALQWQRPDGTVEIIPQSVLSHLPVANLGLIGEYYWGDTPWDVDMETPPFDVRKDLIVGLATEREEPYNVRWRGQFAAPRAGEYLLAALSAADSTTELYINGFRLFDTGQVLQDATATSATASVLQPTESSSYAEGVIYLTQGWHEVDVRHVPNLAAPALQLFWQPPGSGPLPLEMSYLVPALTPLATTDRMLPFAPPPANDAVDGTGNFALSYGTEFWNPQVVMLPTSLPLLPFEQLWTVGACGPGDDVLDQPHGVAVSGIRRLIYVADTANRRVVEYTFDGTRSQIYQNPEWEEPVDIALIDEGFPVVLDAATQQLYTLNPITGASETRPSSTSFYRPRGMATDAWGNLLVADTGGARIIEMGPSGDVLGLWGGPETPLGRGQPTDVVSTAGKRWAITPEDGRLWHLDSRGSIAVIERTNTLNGPHLAGLANGALLVSDPARRLILYLASTGEPRAIFAMPQFNTPTGIAAAQFDRLLYLAVVDTAQCKVSFWRTPISRLP